VEGKGWVMAKDLQVGDDVHNAKGGTGEVEEATIEQTTQEMYNLTVDQAHTFYVGHGQWLVHNRGPCDQAALARALESKVGDNKQAHHLIPCELCSEPVVKLAIKGGFPFNGKPNGLFLPDNIDLSRELNLPVHRGPHDLYTDAVLEDIKLLNIKAQVGNWLPADARTAIENLTTVQLMNRLRALGGGIYLK
jgi:A nuclease family of the HNH/ENDO VII superfamily with conserved AHH/Pretoxin HINT domain